MLYRFEFPERPGALLKFLHAVGPRWNISLFHYRNHGSDYGRVLTGIQVPPRERPDFLQHSMSSTMRSWRRRTIRCTGCFSGRSEVRARERKAPSGGRRKYVPVGSGAVPYCASPRKGPFSRAL